MQSDYLTIAQEGFVEETIRKSRFICHLKRTSSEAEALLFIEEIKKLHNKATHNCSAFLIGEQSEIQRANDDGEPSGTAGLPILDVLKKNDLKNVTAVVTRYFGGVKLGAGGLIRAYGGVVSLALQEIGIVERIRMQVIHLTVPYTLSGRIENELRESSFLLKDISYTEDVTFICWVTLKEVEHFTALFTDASNGQAIFEPRERTFTEIAL